MDFNYIDAFVLIVLGYSFYKGFSKGFVIVLASFVALILGVIGAIYFSDYAAEMFKSKTDISEEYISIAAFSLTFMGIIIGVHLIAKVVNQAVKMVALGPLNKVMGGFFNILKTVIILSVVFYLFDFFNSQFTLVKKKTLNESVAYPTILGITEKVLPLFTKTDWYNPNKLEEAIDDLKDAIEEEIIDKVTGEDD